MVQLLLARLWGTKKQAAVPILMAALLLAGSFASAKSKPKPTTVQVPQLLLDGGRKLTFERSFLSDRDVRSKPGFFTRVFDLVVGAPDLHFLVRPYSVVKIRAGG